MRTMAMVVLFAGALAGAQKFASRKVSDEFIGAWRLVSYERAGTGGVVVHPFGDNPVGRLAYDPEGRMYAQIMRSGRTGVSTPEEKIAAFDGYIAYYGSYTVNPADHTVAHHVEASLNPGWVGTDLVRSYEFSDGRLILRGKSANGTFKLVWERAK